MTWGSGSRETGQDPICPVLQTPWLLLRQAFVSQGRASHFISQQLGKNNDWLREQKWGFIRASVTGWGLGLNIHISSELADTLHSGSFLSSPFCPNPPLSDCPSMSPTLLHLPWISGNTLFMIDHTCLLSAALSAPCKPPSVLATDKFGHVTHTSSFPPF